MRLRPYITEKSVEMAKSGKFTLEVDFNATKTEVEHLVKKFYSVKPISINSVKGKYLTAQKLRKQISVRGIKKVIVKLEKGQKIPGFEFEAPEEKKETKEKKTKKVKDDKES